jgi:hypothetical protein
MTAALPEFPSGREVRELTEWLETNLMHHRRAVSAGTRLSHKNDLRRFFFLRTGARSRQFDLTERLRGSRVAERDRKGGQYEV